MVDPSTTQPTTDGSTAAPVSTGTETSQSVDELLASLDKKDETSTDATLDPEFVKRLESLDVSKLPETIRRKIEAPFNADYTKKTQELARDRERVAARDDQLLKVIEKLTADKGVTPTPNELDELKTKVREGDNDALFAYIDKMFHDRVDNDPRMRTVTMREATMAAAQLMPELGNYEKQVAEALKGDRTLMTMATANNFSFAPQVIAGLAYQQGYMDLKAKIDKIPALIEKAGKDAVEKYKAEVRGAATTTSRAGATPTAVAGEKNLTLRDAMEESWHEAGGT